MTARIMKRNMQNKHGTSDSGSCPTRIFECCQLSLIVWKHLVLGRAVEDDLKMIVQGGSKTGPVNEPISERKSTWKDSHEAEATRNAARG